MREKNTREKKHIEITDLMDEFEWEEEEMEIKKEIEEIDRKLKEIEEIEEGR